MGRGRYEVDGGHHKRVLTFLLLLLLLLLLVAITIEIFVPILHEESMLFPPRVSPYPG